MNPVDFSSDTTWIAHTASSGQVHIAKIAARNTSVTPISCIIVDASGKSEVCKGI